MKQLFISLFVLLANVGWAHASTVETTLWEETYTGEIGLNSETVATFKAGDVLRVYVTVPAGGANFKICYKGAPEWSETTIPSIGDQWAWVNSGETYKDFTLTQDDLTAMTGKNIYIYQGANSTITKVSLITTVADEEGTATVVWSGSTETGNWSSNIELTSNTYKTILAKALVNDHVRVTFSVTTNANAKVQISNASWSSLLSEDVSYEEGAAQTKDYAIADAKTMEDIRTGINIQGNNVTVTKVELITYTTSYDAAAVTIGEDGMATWSSSKKLNFEGTGIKAYYASAVTTGSVTLTSVATTWDYQGYVLVGAEGTYTVPVTTEAEYPSTNYLKATSDYATMVYRSAYETYSDGNDSNNDETDTEEYKIKNYYRYIFAKDSENNIAFYKLVTDYTLGAHKAYLEYSTDVTPTAGARVSLLFSDDETTAVQTIEAIERPQSDKIYNISGQQVVKPTRGFYIINGKKVIIK